MKPAEIFQSVFICQNIAEEHQNLFYNLFEIFFNPFLFNIY